MSFTQVISPFAVRIILTRSLFSIIVLTDEDHTISHSSVPAEDVYYLLQKLQRRI